MSKKCSSSTRPPRPSLMIRKKGSSAAKSSRSAIFMGCSNDRTCQGDSRKPRMATPRGQQTGAKRSADWRRNTVGAGRKIRVPAAHCARVSDHGTSEVDGRGARVGRCAGVVPVEDVFAEFGIPVGSGGWDEAGVERVAGRGGERGERGGRV